MDPVVLNWLVSSGQNWAAEGSKELENVRNSLEQITNELDFSILRKIIMSAGTKAPDAQSISYFQTTVTQRVQEVATDVSKVTLGKIINFLKAINNVLTSR